MAVQKIFTVSCEDELGLKTRISTVRKGILLWTMKKVQTCEGTEVSLYGWESRLNQ